MTAAIVAIVAISSVSVMLAVLLIWREVAHDEERQDLLNRIMAKDYQDYARNSQVRDPPRVGGVLRRVAMERHPAYNLGTKEGD